MGRFIQCRAAQYFCPRAKIQGEGERDHQTFLCRLW
jgi:hypothetical protein